MPWDMVVSEANSNERRAYLGSGHGRLKKVPMSSAQVNIDSQIGFRSRTTSATIRSTEREPGLVT
jgi:hypothetical protein